MAADAKDNKIRPGSSDNGVHQEQMGLRSDGGAQRGLIFCNSPASAALVLRISYSACRFIQNCSEVPKKRASRTAVSALIPRFSSTTSLSRGAGTRIALASA